MAVFLGGIMIEKARLMGAAILGLIVMAAIPVIAVDAVDTRLVADPAISAQYVAFSYAEDLWIVSREGGAARRLTSHSGVEQRPRFSPDGRYVAFTGEYDGNTDVYIISVDGGAPRRLTWHPARDVVQGFTPNGDVLFVSFREAPNWRHSYFFTIPVGGGFPSKLPVPFGFKGSLSPDGSTLAYLPNGEAFRQWKNYRGGTASRIWQLNLGSLEYEQVMQPEGRCNDTDPMWIGDELFFLSDREGEFNLYQHTGDGSIHRLTDYDDFPVVAASAGDGFIIYEQAGWLHIYDPSAKTSERFPVGAAADLVETRARYSSGDQWIRSAGLSPSGARAVFEFRGEVVTVPAENGDPRVLTQTPGVHERSPAWSPDGASIAYVSDDGGEYRLHLAPQNGQGEVRTFDLEGAGFADDLKWSPDSKSISYVDNAPAVWVLDLGSGAALKVSAERLYGPVRAIHHAWSPDSKWLAYTRNNLTLHNQVFLYDVKAKTSHAVTEGLADATDPTFDSSGRYLYMTASTDAGPVRQWFAMSNADMKRSNSLYLAVLSANEVSPLAPESDEEKPAKDSDGDANDQPSEKKEGGDQKDVEVTIDLEGISQRIVALPVKPGLYSDLQAGSDGSLLYLREKADGSDQDLVRFDLDEKEETVLLADAQDFVAGAGGAKVLVKTEKNWHIAEAAAPIKEAESKVDTSSIKVRIDPQMEWPQIFNEAWRINRDWFYDPNMHGADWPLMKEKYEVFLPHLAVRSDLNRVIQWMCSELSVGHHRVGGGDRRDEPGKVPGGLLGADFEVSDGRFRFASIYGGLNWNPDLRAPLTEPGVDVQRGEYLLTVNGRELHALDNPYSFFENSVGTMVELEVGPNADGSDSRVVEVVPIKSDSALRNRAWVEGNIRKVHEATDGRVAYVYVPNTAGLGHTYFKRYFFPQADKQAIIVDERFNRGGQVADYYIDILLRPLVSYWNTRYGEDFKTPLSSIQGPKVMIIDETAGSGGDMLPWMFRKFDLGPLVGRPTWGGLVGVLGFPVLMDGGYVTAPNLAIWTEDGFIVENVGVPPDFEVEQLPKAVAQGHDPQLEKAIELVLQQLGANPPKAPERPPYPIRVRQ